VAIHIALLRAVNVAGHGKLPMADLRKVIEGLGFTGVQTLLASGNAVFTGPAQKPERLEALLEEATAKRLGLTTDFMVRTPKEWQAVIADNPFPAKAKADPGHLVVVSLKDAPPAKAEAALREAIKGPEVVRLQGRHLYAVYPAGQGTSKLTNVVIERKLGTRGTARNWNTVLKLGALAGA
jgi:uncharacterized protein (DUF1697 family)